MDGAVTRIEERRGVGKPVIPTRRWEDNIKMDLQNVGWCGEHGQDLTEDRGRWRALVNTLSS